MNQMKKSYIKPILCSEAFVPSSYVAACVAENGETTYYLQCDGDYMNDRLPHTEEGCLRSTAYTITVKDNKITNIYEAPNVHGFQGADVTNIKIDGKSINDVTLDPNASYTLTWETYFISTYHHKGTFSTKTAINVNNS